MAHTDTHGDGSLDRDDAVPAEPPGSLAALPRLLPDGSTFPPVTPDPPPPPGYVDPLAGADITLSMVLPQRAAER